MSAKLDTSDAAAIDARLIAEFLEGARKDGALVDGAPLCFAGLTPRLSRFLISGFVIRAHSQAAGLPDPYPHFSPIGNALAALALMHMRAMDEKKAKEAAHG